MATIETVLANAASLVTKQREEYGNTTSLYRLAAILATNQLDRPFSPQDIARVVGCVTQARQAIRPDIETNYAELSAIMAVAASLPTDTIQRPNLSDRLEESLDEAGRRIAKAFAPSLPKAETSTEN